MKFDKDARVFGPHGPGTIAEVRTPRGEQYTDTNRGFETALNIASSSPELVNLLAGSLYSPDRYPYVVQFDCGYREVYGDSSLEPYLSQPYKGCSDICPATYKRKFQKLLDNEKE
jgi:hypothetical protein